MVLKLVSYLHQQMCTIPRYSMAVAKSVNSY